MYYKIQPEQIQLHTFSSPSGDISFDIGSNYVYANLSRYLTGNFAITGDLSVNGRPVIYHSDTNNAHLAGNTTISCQTTIVSGTGNTLINCDSVQARGTNNIFIGAEDVDANASSYNNLVLGGRGVGINSGVYGTVILKDDSNSDFLTVARSNNLYIQFESGIDVGGSGLRLNSANLEVDGHILLSGKVVATQEFATGITSTLSGNLNTTGQSLNTYIINTGSTLSSNIASTGSALVSTLNTTGARLNSGITALSGQSVFTTSNQTISGQKTFHESQIFSQSIFLKGSSGNFQGVTGSTQIVPTGSGDSAGGRGLIAYSGEFLFYKISDSPHLWVRHSGQLMWP